MMNGIPMHDCAKPEIKGNKNPSKINFNSTRFLNSINFISFKLLRFRIQKRKSDINWILGVGEEERKRSFRNLYHKKMENSKYEVDLWLGSQSARFQVEKFWRKEKKLMIFV